MSDISIPEIPETGTHVYALVSENGAKRWVDVLGDNRPPEIPDDLPLGDPHTAPFVNVMSNYLSTAPYQVPVMERHEVTSPQGLTTTIFNGINVPGGKIFYTQGTKGFLFDPVNNTLEARFLDNTLNTGPGHKALLPDGRVLVGGAKTGQTRATIWDLENDTVELSPAGYFCEFMLATANGKIIMGTDDLRGSCSIIDLAGPTGTGFTVNYLTAPCLGMDGKAYGIPKNREDIAVVDPYTYSVGSIGQGSFKANVNAWYNGAIAKTGEIVCVPYSDDNYSFLFINTSARRARNVGNISPATNCNACVCGPNGYIYANSNSGLIEINPVDSTYRLFSLRPGATQLLPGPDGKLYTNVYRQDATNSYYYSIDLGATLRNPDVILSPYLNRSK